MNIAIAKPSKTFVWRRVHSLMGLWLVIYLIQHLIINSQAALWLGEDGMGFVRLVNLLESLPYLHVLEIVLIAIPLFLHGYWGIQRIFMAKNNAFKDDGSIPELPFERNRSFQWQRWTSWILLFGIIAHVIQMRFVEMPKKVGSDFVVQIQKDDDLDKIAKKLQVKLEERDGNVYAFASTPGKAMLLMVRETFKSPGMAIVYSLFVLAASFHAFNGFWTSLITWGAILSYRSQRAFLPICWIGSGLLSFLGLAAIWGSYWLSVSK